MTTAIRRIFPVLAAIFLASGPTFASEEDFFKGKTIRFVVGFSAGGGFDAYSRLIARHFSKHVPGKPVTIVENMTGAGSLIAANYIYNRAKPDGLTIGNWIGSLVLQQVMDNPAAKFDARNFGWLGAPVPDLTTCALTSASGITSMDQWLTAKRPIKLGGTGPGSNTVDPPKILKEVLRLPVQIIEGYKGTADMLLAMKGGELDGGCWSWPAMKVMLQKERKEKSAHVVIQFGDAPDPGLKDVPLAIRYARTDEARELIQIGVHDQSRIMRPYSLPPETPKERVAALQKALMDTLKDPEFLAEAEKAKFDLEPVEGREIEKIVARLYQANPATIGKLKRILLPEQTK